MEMEITVRHHELPEKVKEYAKNEMAVLEKYFDRIVSARMILDTQKEGEIAELTLHITGKDIIAKEISDNFTKSIDAAVKKATTQLKRYIEKRNNQ
ncbi:MAG: ribosome-associated translation inhibitor RaiA [Candidatus Marinimicrobia bacterium]|nr:ribosome-associated translation inhibitor RaiA [Candidatus Neomarinimicrobiota bacterium]